ncbi:MAG: ATP-binding protein [Bacteroidota bacterium]|nr:ATP-binding protein [Bacteroidota bacterium]
MLLNIEEQKKTLYNNELNLAIEIAELANFHVDLTTNTATYSPLVNKWFGLHEQGLNQEAIFNCIHEEDRQRVWQAIQTTLQPEENQKHDVTYRVNCPDENEIKHLRSVGKTFFDENGKPEKIIGIIQDVTQQVFYKTQMEESELQLQKRVNERATALEQQKLFISSILDASFNGIYALKAIRNEAGVILDFSYLFVNNIIAQILQMDADDVVGKTLLELIPENKNNGFFDLFKSVLYKKESVREESYFTSQRFSGWFAYAMVPIDNETLVVTVQDITEQKQTLFHKEQQRNLLDKIMNHSPSGITVTEVIRNEAGDVIDTITITANAISEKFVGLPLDVILSKRTSEIEPAFFKSALFHKVVHTLATGEPFITQYYLEATGRWLELSVAKMDENHLINVFTDVTPIKETQIQLEKYVEELKRSNINLEEFAYAASHDLKEPIRKIHFFSDRLKVKLQGKLEEEDQRLFERMEFAAKRMGSLIDDLLLYSHISKVAVISEEVDLNTKVETVLEDLELEIQDKQAQITVDQLPVIKGHKRQLQQLFQNILSNALKYSKQNTPSIIHINSSLIKGKDTSLHLSGDDVNRLYHLIEVKDNGIGFDQNESHRIFNVFTRLHGNAEFKGTGVGLSIARKVVENHHGYIWAQSEPGIGSTFKILLAADQ